MVLEQIFKLKWIERKEHSFFLGFIYALFGIFSAYLIIPSYAGIMSIGFTSILLIPSLNQLLMQEENVEIREKKFSIIQLFRDHFDIIKVYLFLFFGIFAAYFVLALAFGPSFTASLFKEQLNLTGGIGAAIGRLGLFQGLPHLLGAATKNDFFVSILLNNILVFVICFLLSFFYGAGSILFLTINSSAWGAFFGYTLKQSIVERGGEAATFLAFILPILPHTITEALSYVFAAIVGGIVSKAVLREKMFSKQFNHIVTDAIFFIVIGLVCVTIAGVLEVYVF